MSRDQHFPHKLARRTLLGGTLGAAALWLSGCGGGRLPSFGGGQQPAPQQQPPAQPASIGKGAVRVALILPMSASGNVGLTAQSMKNAAELALSEFKNPNIQILLKDSGGTSFGAQSAAQQAISEGAELILGPLFAQSVAAVAGVARARGIPMIAFSSDTSVAAPGVYLLSFLPQSDVNRIVDYAVSRGRDSFVALIPDNAYGSVVEAAFRQRVGAHRRARIVALERYPENGTDLQGPVHQIALAAPQADALFVPDSAVNVVRLVEALTAAGVNMKRLQLLGTGVWIDSQRQVFSYPQMQGGWYAAAPDTDSPSFRNFAARYRQHYGQEPVRTATLAYDGVALVAALVKTQGAQRFSQQVLTNPSGFAGKDGVFRFLANGTNQRELPVMRVTARGAQVISSAPRTFAQ